MRTLGVILIVVGILMTVFLGFVFTTQKKVADVGPLEINKEQKHYVGWPVWTGGLAVAAGIIILVAGRKK